MRAQPMLLICGACVVGAAAVGLVADLAAPDVVSIPAARQQPSPPERATHVGVRPTVRAPDRTAARPLPTPAPVAEPQTEPSSHERDAQLVARIDANLDERLRSERADPGWARDTEAAIASTLAGTSFSGLRLEAVRCGATLCRVALSASEQVADVDAVVEELTATQPFRHGGFVRFTGTHALTMFVARKGHPLPPAPRS